MPGSFSISSRKGSGTLNVKTWGAQGNGSTDDTAIINAALAATGAYGEIFFPEGIYIISTDLIPVSNISIRGSGKGTIFRAATSTQPNIFNVSGLSHVTFSNFAIDGNKLNVNQLAIQYQHLNGIYCQGSDDIEVSDCYIHDCYVSGIMANGNCTNLTFTRNRMVANFDNQIYVRAKDIAPYNPCTYVTITNNECSGGSFSGIQVLGSSYITISNNVCYSNGPSSGQGDGVGSEGSSYVTFSGNVCYNNGIQGVNIRGTTEVGATQISSHIVAIGNIAYNHTSSNGDAGGFSVTDCDDVTLIGNHIYGNYFGMNITDVMSQGANHVHVVSNTIRGNSNVGLRISPSTGADFYVNANYISDNAGDNFYTSVPVNIEGGVFARAAVGKEGIHLASGANNSRIFGAHVFDNHDNGVLIDSPVSGTEIRNSLFDNVVGTNQVRAVQEQAGAGPTKIVNCRILNQSTNNYVFNHADSRFYDEETVGSVTVTGAYTVKAQDYAILCNYSAGHTVTIPTPTGMNGRKLVVKDVGGNANTNNITVAPASGTVDGAANKVINSAYGVLRLISDGSNWFTL